MASSPTSVILVASRHRPHEQLLLAYSALIGLVYLTTVPAPASLTASLPSLVVTVWAAAMAASGVIGLVGCWWRGERGMGIEAGGLLLNSSALMIYSVAAFGAVGMRALLPGGVCAAWTVANLWRATQVWRELRAIRGGG